MLEGNSPNCSRLPHRYAISSPFFAAYFIISSAVLTDLFFDATNFSSHHNNCDTVSDGVENKFISSPAERLCRIPFMVREPHHERDCLIVNSSIYSFALSLSKGSERIVTQSPKGERREGDLCGGTTTSCTVYRKNPPA